MVIILQKGRGSALYGFETFDFDSELSIQDLTLETTLILDSALLELISVVRLLMIKYKDVSIIFQRRYDKKMSVHAESA